MQMQGIRAGVSKATQQMCWLYEAKKARGNGSPRAFKTIIQVCKLKELSLCVSANGGLVGAAVVERDDVDTGGHVQAARFTG